MSTSSGETDSEVENAAKEFEVANIKMECDSAPEQEVCVASEELAGDIQSEYEPQQEEEGEEEEDHEEETESDEEEPKSRITWSNGNVKDLLSLVKSNLEMFTSEDQKVKMWSAITYSLAIDMPNVNEREVMGKWQSLQRKFARYEDKMSDGTSTVKKPYWYELMLSICNKADGQRPSNQKVSALNILGSVVSAADQDEGGRTPSPSQTEPPHKKTKVDAITEKSSQNYTPRQQSPRPNKRRTKDFHMTIIERRLQQDYNERKRHNLKVEKHLERISALIEKQAQQQTNLTNSLFEHLAFMKERCERLGAQKSQNKEK